MKLIPGQNAPNTICNAINNHFGYRRSSDESLQPFHFLPCEDDPAGEHNSEQAEDGSTQHVSCYAAEKLHNGAHDQRRYDLRQEICTVQDGNVQTHSSLGLISSR